MSRLLALVVVALTLGAGAAQAARGASPLPLPPFPEVELPKLDAVASSVAGHPVTLECVLSASRWAQLATENPENGWGFTTIGSSVIYVGPLACETLVELADGENVGTVEAAQGLLVLAHEAVHQRGVVDEAQTECSALKIAPGLAESFGIPSTVVQTVTRHRTITVRIGKRSKRVRVTYAKTVTVPNPYMARLAADVMRWHQMTPASYQTC